MDEVLEMLHVALYDELTADMAEVLFDDLTDEFNQGLEFIA